MFEYWPGEQPRCALVPADRPDERRHGRAPTRLGDAWTRRLVACLGLLGAAGGRPPRAQGGRRPGRQPAAARGPGCVLHGPPARPRQGRA